MASVKLPTPWQYICSLTPLGKVAAASTGRGPEPETPLSRGSLDQSVIQGQCSLLARIKLDWPLRYLTLSGYSAEPRSS